MAEPGTNGVDIHTGLKQVAGSGVPDHVGRDFPPFQRGHGDRAARHEMVHAEPGIGLAVTAEEHRIAVRPFRVSSARTRSVRGHSGHWRIFPLLPSGYERMAAVGAANLHIGHSQLRGSETRAPVL